MFGKVVGGILGTVAFSVACVVGLLAGNDMTTVLSRALMAMLIFFVVGFIIGVMGRSLINEHMKRVVDTDRQEQRTRMEHQRGGEQTDGAPGGGQTADETARREAGAA
jgi:hypothetical protein